MRLYLCKYSCVFRAAKVRYDDPLRIWTTGITCNHFVTVLLIGKRQ